MIPFMQLQIHALPYMDNIEVLSLGRVHSAYIGGCLHVLRDVRNNGSFMRLHEMIENKLDPLTTITEPKTTGWEKKHAYDFECFKYACQEGDLETVEAIYDRSASVRRWCNKTNRQLQYNLLRSASVNGHINVVRWMEKNIRLNETFVAKVLFEVVEQRNVEIIAILYYMCKYEHRRHIMFDQRTLIDICAKGQMYILKWFRKVLTETTTSVATTFLQPACLSGNLSAAIWVYDEIICNNRVVNMDRWRGHCSLLCAICRRGYLHVLVWYCRAFSLKLNENVRTLCYEYAKASGHNHIMNWLTTRDA